MKKSVSVWDIFAWVVLAGIFLWLILKVTGVINTPLILEYAPYFGAVYLAGWQIHKLHIVAEDVRDLKKFERETVNQISGIKSNCIMNHR